MKFYLKKRNGKENLVYTCVDRIITLKLMSNQWWFRQWIVLNWVSIFCVDGLLKQPEGILSFQNGLTSVSSVTFS